jgi:hypothetical protein
MRSDSLAFAALNAGNSKEPRYVVRITYPVDSLYITSHAGISGVPGTVIQGALEEPSIISQRLNPIEGRSEIGSASFSVVDVASELTAEIRERLTNDEGMRGRQVSFWLGYSGLAFSDFVLIGTQQVVEASFDAGRYAIKCADIQRSAKKDLFTLAETQLATSISDTDTTVSVVATTGFSTVYHGPTYSDAPSSTVGYFKIRDEVIRYTGKTSTTFTGCTRGALGTIAAKYDVDASTPASRREKITEHVYLELPAVKLAYAILTGTLYGDAATLPVTWHLGISSSLVRLSDFLGLGADLWDGSNGGVVIRFENIKKTDGKKFLEEEVCRLLGCFMPVYADGALGFRRATRVLADSATVATLDESNAVQVGELVHDMDALHNAFRIQWNWTGSDFTRTTTLIDTDSATIHGTADALELKFKGLYGGRATDSLIFQLVDSLRDRYAAPPQRLTVEVLHSLNRLEVGDVVRVRFANVRDFAGSGTGIDRAFEIQNISVNHRTGAVSLELFGSTAPASAISPTAATTALPDAWYTSAGTALSSVATITAGVMATGTYSLAGASTLTATGSIWYHAGDLTIPTGTTLNISGNVQLRVRGYLTVNGTINGVATGIAGTNDTTNTTVQAGTPGFVGNSRGRDGQEVSQKGGNPIMRTIPAPLTVGKNPTFPYLEVSVVSGALSGLPADLRGTGGAPGGKVQYQTSYRARGGHGGAGGAGLAVISRGFSTGVSALINLSGADGGDNTFWDDEGKRWNSGGGGAGGPGAFLLLLDGSTVSAPDLTNRLRCRTGTVPSPAPYDGKLKYLDIPGDQRYSLDDRNFAGYPDPSVISLLDLSFAAQRIQFIPAPETATADLAAQPPAITALTAAAQDGFALISWTLPADPASYDAVELFSSITNVRNDAVKVFDGRASAFQHVTNDTTLRYYWVRTRRARVRSEWFPATTTSSVSVGARPPTLAGYLTNEAHVLAADATGAVASFSGAGGTFKVLAGSLDVTTSCTFSLLGTSNVTASINATSGVYSVTAMTADTGTATLRATYAGVTLDKVFTVSKSRQGLDGSASAAGTSNAVVYAYQRATTAPSLPSASVTYTFATGAATGLNNGWTQTIPAGTDAIWITAATASSTTATDTIASGEWAAAVVLAQNGAAGAAGTNAATVYLFQRTASAAPSLPSASVTYTFATGVATGVNNGWTQTLPTTGGAARWMTTATALGTGATDTIAAGEWAAVSLLAQDGTNGTNGSDGTRGAGVFTVAVGATGTNYNISSADATLWDGGTLTAAAAQEAAAVVIALGGNGFIEPRDTLTIYESGVRAAQRIYQGTRTATYTAVGSGDWSTKVAQAIDGSLIVTGTLSAAQITTGTLSASRINIDGLSLTNSGGQLAIASNGVTTTLINDGAVTGGKLGAGSVTSTKLADGALEVAKFASGLRPIEIVATLPVTGNVEGRLVYLTTDDKLYRYTGSSFVSTIAAADVTGTLADAQLAAIAASKVTGTLTNAQIADLAATKITGTLTNAQIADLAAAKVTGQITTTQITDSAVTTAKVNAGAVTTAKIAALAVTAGEIAADAITTAKIAAGAVVTAKLAAGAVTANEIAANAITAVKINAGAVETAKLAAGAVTAATIAAGAVTTQKLLVTGAGSSITDDPNTQDASAWTGGTFAIVTDTTSPTGKALEITSNGTTTYSSTLVPLDAAKNYNARIWARQVSGTPNSYLLIAFYDGAGNILDGTTYPTGWPGAGSFHYFGVVNAVIPTSWTEYQISFGPGETAKIPTGAKFVRIGALANFTAAGTSRFSRFLITEKTSGQLIVDGEISAAKLAANSVVAGKIAAAAVSTTELAARSISAEKLRIGSLDNLISNGNFATGDLSDMRAFSGTWSVVLRNASGVPAGAASTNVAKAVAAGTEASLFTGAKAYTDTDSFLYSVQCKPGEVFYISADVAAQSGTTGSVGLYAWHFIAGTGATGVDYTAVQLGTLSTSWQTLSGRFVVPAGVIGFWLYVYHSGLSAAGTTFTSNLRVIRAATGELVVDGAITAAKLEADLVLASTFKTAASGYRTEISNSGSYPIWYGTGTKNDANGLFYVKTDGAVYFKGTVGTGSKIEIFTVTIAAITGTASGAAGTGNVTSAAASVTLTNGTASYTYLWEHVGQIMGETPTCSSTTAAAPTFSRTAVDANEPSSSIWRCTVTDSKGNVASSQAYVRLIWVDTR